MTTIDWPPTQRRRPRGRVLIVAVLAAIVLGAGTALSYYVESLWFESLGFEQIFWTSVNLQAAVFTAFAAITFLLLYAAFLALKPPQLGALAGGTILVNGQPIRLPVEPVIRAMGVAIALAIAALTGVGLGVQWRTFALYWYGGPDALGAAAATAAIVDPIFGRPLSFYFFTLPAWRLIGGWLTTVAVVACAASIGFAVIVGGARVLEGRRAVADRLPLRGVSATFALVLLTVAFRVYLGRFDRIYTDHTIFAGVTYTDAHVTITGLLFVAIALVAGALIAAINALRAPSAVWLGAAVAPAAIVYVVVGVIGWYVNGFIVKPNELVRERPFITNNIELTRRAYGIDRMAQQEFAAESGLAAADLANTQETLQNIRLWDWRALQDTLRQIQEIRTYYDFPDIDIDRYEIGGTVRQMMLAVRELNVERLPESSRNWINEKLVYTHGYGITMNSATGFTPEGLPALVLSDMPVRSTVPGLTVSRPEIYFGELTNRDVYVRTRQQEFNYPQGETNSVTSYEGTGGIVLGSFVRRLLLALDRGDIAKLPFSDDVNRDSRLLMRRNIRQRAETIAPFLLFDDDPYIVLGDEGRLFWMMDAFTTADTYPYSRHYRTDRRRLNYMRNSVKVVIDAYDGATTFYIFDADDPIVAAHRAIFPSLFKDASAMPATLRKHVRYPELLLDMQAAVYGLYHMTDPDVFYNREDLWTIASEVTMTAQREQAAMTMEPNYLLMKLPGERATEFVEVLPFTPANRNNLIGWIAGRSDDPHYGTALVYHFPKTRLVDGPLQIEARIDQNAQLSSQLTLWNQQGSSVRRGSLLVIPVGRALLYAQTIYLQAERSPMPELRIVVLAMQDRLAYGPTFERALAALLGNAPSTLDVDHPAASVPPPAAAGTAVPQGAPAPADTNTLISAAARDLADYQRLTAEGRLGEAGQRLEALKQKLEELNRRR